MAKAKWIGCLCGLTVIGMASSPSWAAISQQFFVSDTNKLYFVVVADQSGGAIGSQVTSLMMTSGTALPVNETPNNPPDPIVTSFASFITGGILHVPPLSNLQRTALLTGFTSNNIENAGNPMNGVFDPHANGGSGLLTLPGGARTVAFDGSGTEPLVPITTATGAGLTLVPAAATTTITRVVGNTHFTTQTIVFPNPPGPPVTSAGASCVGGTGTDCDPGNGIAVNPDCPGGMCSNFGGEAPGQNVTLDDTLLSRVGNPASQGAEVDGFFLRDTTTIIVFLVDDGASAFGLTADGFAVTGTCSTADIACETDADCVDVDGTCTDGLAARQVVNTTGDVDNGAFLPTPTSTPSNTPTRTSTVTATATETDTPTNTPTDTPTAADTATATSTITNTATATHTASNTPTHTATATNTASPTATPSNSPTATAGAEEICRTKGFWGEHACPENASGTSVCEKSNSQNITQQVIDAAGGSISVCGKTLTDTHLNHQHSAEEALCVKIQGTTVLQLASQLTAAALNCVISGNPSTCAGSSIAAEFTACNMACAAGNTTAVVEGVKIDCIHAIDCANNGGNFNTATGHCQRGTCSDNGAPCDGEDLASCANPATATCVLDATTCHDRPLCNRDLDPDLCFEPPGPAGSSKQCNDARSNPCTIFSGAPPCAQ